MTHYIITENSLPVPSTEKPLPPRYMHQSYPSLEQFAALKAAEGVTVAGYLPPAYDSKTHALGEYVAQGAAWTREVVTRPAEEIAADLEADRAAAVVNICRIAKDLIEAELNPLGGFKVVELAQAGKQRSIDTFAWVESKYMAVEVRKAEVGAGLWDDDLTGAQDLSFIGKKPWTVAQILAEA